MQQRPMLAKLEAEGIVRDEEMRLVSASGALRDYQVTFMPFVHDGQPGGAGFAERGFHAARLWLTTTRDAIASALPPR